MIGAGAGNVVVKAAVRAVVAVRVVSAVRTVVGVSAGMVATGTTPGVIVVVIAAVPVVVGDVGVVIEDDGTTTAASPAATPIAVPVIPSPGEPSAADEAATTEECADGDANSEGNDGGCVDDRRSVERNYVGSSVDDGRIVLWNVDDL